MQNAAVQDVTPSQNIYLSIEDLWKKFGEFVALKDISLEVIESEFLCFLGPSGCGKTTLLRAIAGLDLQTSGKIEQAGKDVSNLPPSERDFGIVFQSYALFPNLTIERNIAYGLENAGRPKQEISARVSELLELVGLPDQGKNIQRSSRVDNNNASPWRAQLLHPQVFCYWMSRFLRSMPKFVCICATKLKNCNTSSV